MYTGKERKSPYLYTEFLQLPVGQTACACWPDRSTGTQLQTKHSAYLGALSGKIGLLKCVRLQRGE